MKKRKFFVIATLILILSLSIVFCACDPGDDVDPDDGDITPVGDCTITYEQVDGVQYSSQNPTTIQKGESATIEFTVDVFYDGEPVVKVNGKAKDVEYDEDTYTYSCKTTIVKDTTISVEGIAPAESELLSTGTGASDSPFIISKPIDLIKMAEVINSGADDSTMSVLGYYVLENDIDMRGKELNIIGDGNNEYAFFGGYFNGGGHKISNFKINSNGNDYVGLFGIVQAYYYDSLGFSGGVIYNLKLSDYTIVARNNGTTVTCGSFVGQGFGANLVLCEAINGTLDVMGDENYFSYAGGIIGLQRSYMYPYYSKISYCSTDNVNIGCSNGTTYAAGGIAGYVYSDDDTIATTIANCYTTGRVSGAFHAGGIVGWLSNYTSMSACYSTCDVHAQSHMSNTSSMMETYCHAYAGSLVGMAQLDSVVADSFSTGKVTANAAAGSSYAHIGDIVGRTEDLQDGMYSAKETGIFNCYHIEGGKNDKMDLTKADTIKKVLGWHEIDWIIEDGKYPVVNTINSSTDEDTEIEHYTYTVTLDFGTRKDNKGNSKFEAEFTDQYESMNYWYNVYLYSDESDIDGIPSSITSTDGYVSYGYFFDKELTIPVSTGFVPMRDITLYVGFANNNDVAGTYYVLPNSDVEESNNLTIELTINVDGTYKCVDRLGSFEGTYVYNGKYIVFDDARFARYYGEGSIANYQAYEFKAVKSFSGFELYGGLYSDTELNEVVELVPREEPLKIVKVENVLIGSYYYKDGANTIIYEFFANGNGYYYENGIPSELVYTVSGQSISIVIDEDKTVSGAINNGVVEKINSISVTQTDAYRGKWEISSLPQKYMEFDGAGNWTYIYYGYEKSGNEMYQTVIESQDGTYIIDNGNLVLSNGAVVSIKDGFVNVISGGASYVYGGINGNYGLWTNLDKDIIINLKGISANGYGLAQIRFVTNTNGRVRNEIYELSYAQDMLIEGNIVLFYEGEYYGSLAYDENNGVLQGSIYSLAESDMMNIRFYRVDEYQGEWISTDGTFSVVDFNGYGVYSILGDVALNGTISIGDTTVNYRLDDFSLSGTFTYGGKLYSITLDEGRNIITIDEGSIELIRKDEFGEKTFLDAEGNEYYFDGKGAIGGTLTVTVGASTTTYKYVIDADGTVSVYDGDNKVGAISVKGEIGSRNYVLTLDGQDIVLGEKTQFTGTWALQSSFGDYVVIGTMNYDKVLKGNVPLMINNKSDNYDATFTLVDDEYLVWVVNDSLNLYVVQITDGMFVVSQHLNWFNYENDYDNGEWNYSYMMLSDELTGSWSNERQSQIFIFDGTGKNPEALAMYSVNVMYASDEDGDPEIYYYGYFERADKSGYDFLLFNNYSTYAKSASKVIFKDPTGDRKEYVNEAGDRAFTLEDVNLEDYIITREQ